MFGSAILDVAVGMVFFYLLLSLICSAVNELLEGWMKNRAKDLEKGLRELLQDPDGTGLVKAVYEHPLINGLFAGRYDPRKTGNLPSYIPARSFALALLDSIPPAGAPPVSSGGAAAAPAASIPAGVSRALEMFRIDPAQTREHVEAWFNNCMDRVAGWYKRRAQLIIFCVGLGCSLAINADSIVVARGLANDNALRDSAVAAASNYIAQNPGGPAVEGTPDQRLKQYLNTVAGVGLPIGWEKREVDTPGRIPDPSLLGILLKLVGCFLTACAISLGAPFWFDMLKKVMTIRSTVKAQEKPAA